MFKTTKDFMKSAITLLVYSPPGQGKTRLIRTLPNLKKVLIINLENGLLSIARGEAIDVYDCTVDKDGNALPRVMRFEKLIYFLEKIAPTLKDKYDWFVFDSLTEASQNLVEFLEGKWTQKKDALNLWGEYTKVLTALIKQLRDNGKFNILLLALSSVDKDEAGRRFIGVDINGKLAQRLPAFLDEVFYYEVYEKEGKKIPKLITSTFEKTVAKDRSGTLDQFEDPDLTKIMLKIQGGEIPEEKPITKDPSITEETKEGVPNV